ncbi:MAG: polysulfide reductase NrfD [Anaerolineales bacterium]|nr:polysulfide reductase NrfD [Anaerolineales bacterium]MCA9929456.1 polysulfide reductase NrfD [Anaerolineales bacterium]
MDYPIHIPKLRIGKRELDVFPLWIFILLLGFGFGAVGGFQVFKHGLSVTGLNDHVPWGLWIVIDISSIALGGGAFTMGVVVYLLKIKRFEHIGRLAVLIGFLGYSTAGMVLLFDLGQPLRFWHPVVFWQPHSLLWEITMCVVLYLTVLVLEMFPAIIEHPIFARFPFLIKITHLHKMGPALAVMGLTLSLLHQASLGATYGVLSGRGLWFRPTAPVMFVMSAVGGGLALLFVLSVFVFRVMRPGLVKDDVLAELARIVGYVLLLCIYLKLWDWAVTYYYSFDNDVAMQIELLNNIAPYDWSFWLGQVLMGGLIPGFTLITYRPGKNLRLRVVVSLMAAACVVIMRWNYNFSGLLAAISYDPYTPTIQLGSYIPTWQEIAVGLGVISYWLLGFSLAARFLPFYDTHETAVH